VGRLEAWAREVVDSDEPAARLSAV
jgi:hypothetical protein